MPMPTALFNDRADNLRRRVLSPVGFKLFMLRQLPLAAFAGLKLRSLDEGGCTVILPGGKSDEAILVGFGIAKPLGAGAPAHGTRGPDMRATGERAMGQPATGETEGRLDFGPPDTAWRYARTLSWIARIVRGVPYALSGRLTT